jgi:hypothetical protein
MTASSHRNVPAWFPADDAPKLLATFQVLENPSGCRVFRESRRPDSNRGPLHYEGGRKGAAGPQNTADFPRTLGISQAAGDSDARRGSPDCSRDVPAEVRA